MLSNPSFSYLKYIRFVAAPLPEIKILSLISFTLVPEKVEKFNKLPKRIFLFFRLNDRLFLLSSAPSKYKKVLFQGRCDASEKRWERHWQKKLAVA